MSRDVERSLLDIDFVSLTRGPFTPSPAAGEGQVLYFLMLDRFSDGNEQGGCGDTPGWPVETRPDGAAWPRQSQRGDLFLRKGRIDNWAYYPEYAEGDMAIRPRISSPGPRARGTS